MDLTIRGHSEATGLRGSEHCTDSRRLEKSQPANMTMQCSVDGKESSFVTGAVALRGYSNSERALEDRRIGVNVSSDDPGCTNHNFLRDQTMNRKWAQGAGTKSRVTPGTRYSLSHFTRCVG